MIVVIADDFTGAAELGGIGLRHGLRTEVCVEVPVEVNDGLELLVVATDTRSKAVSAAVADMLEVTRQVLRLAPEFVYKKTDSVLRGHVVAELKVHMGVLGMKQTLLVPATPVLGRVVRHGHYFVNGIPVHETSFAEDPEFPVRSNDVKVMLGGGAAEIVVGDAETPEDLWDWAGKVGPGVLAAGAASFFSAILDRRRLPVLYVSGTTFDSS
ncbi:MAG TPA: four-carbon acid sugar kinase family protein, partial [Puia sp.]